MPEPRRLAIVGYGKMGRLVEQFAPEFGFDVALKLVEEMKKAGYTRPIDVSSNRTGKHPGTHEIGFDSGADTITLRHTARNREGFARGALKAAQRVVGQKGFFEFSGAGLSPAR